MALIRCPDCKRPFSRTAPACPHCGRPADPPPTPEELRQKEARHQAQQRGGCLGVLLVVGIIVAVVVIGAMSPNPRRGRESEASAPAAPSCDPKGFRLAPVADYATWPNMLERDLPCLDSAARTRLADEIAAHVRAIPADDWAANLTGYQVLQLLRPDDPTIREKIVRYSPIPRKGDDEQFNLTQLAMDLVRQRMRDPDAAKFRNVHYYSGGRAHIVCGEVNGKNAFGAYTGYEPFMSAGTPETTALQSQVEGFNATWKHFCRN